MTGPAHQDQDRREPAKGARKVVRFDRIQQLRAHEYVAEQIRRHIGLRLIGHGDVLPSERELAEMFGVGRPTIQLALGLLGADRLIEARRGRRGGTFVIHPTEDLNGTVNLASRLWLRRDEIEELLVYRATLEPGVAGVAAVTRTPDDLAAMQSALRGMDVPAPESEYMRHDTEFHLAIARATRNRYLLEEIEQIRIQLNDALSLLPETEAWHRRIHREHLAIFEAIDGGRVDEAIASLGFHVANSNRGVHALLASIGRRRVK